MGPSETRHLQTGITLDLRSLFGNVTIAMPKVLPFPLKPKHQRKILGFSWTSVLSTLFAHTLTNPKKMFVLFEDADGALQYLNLGYSPNQLRKDVDRAIANECKRRGDEVADDD